MYFSFEPGDGSSYRVLFGRTPGRGLVPFYTVFGIAEGSSEAGCWYAFDTDHVSFDTFTQHLFAYTAFSPELALTAWRLWLAVTGQADDAGAAAQLASWRDDWRRQLPTAALG